MGVRTTIPELHRPAESHQLGKAWPGDPPVRGNNAPSTLDPTPRAHWPMHSWAKPQIILKINAKCRLCKDCQISTKEVFWAGLAAAAARVLEWETWVPKSGLDKALPPLSSSASPSTCHNEAPSPSLSSSGPSLANTSRWPLGQDKFWLRPLPPRKQRSNPLRRSLTGEGKGESVCRPHLPRRQLSAALCRTLKGRDS